MATKLLKLVGPHDYRNLTNRPRSTPWNQDSVLTECAALAGHCRVIEAKQLTSRIALSSL
jgi:hypothetical protein